MPVEDSFPGRQDSFGRPIRDLPANEQRLPLL
jgi:hypothetical protein